MATLQLQGVTRVNYFDMTARLTEAVGAAGGWILAHQQFSNLSLCVSFEIGRVDLNRLAGKLSATGLHLSSESRQELLTFAMSPEENIAGTLQVTFVHNDPDLVVPLPIG